MFLNIPEAVADYFKEHTPPPRARKPGEYWVTEPAECERAWWRKITSTTEYDPERQGVFEAGKYVEDFVKEVLEWKLKNHEVDIIIPQRSVTFFAGDPYERIVLNGKADFLVLLRSRITQESELLEIKSANRITRIKAAKKDHIIQVTPYQLVLNPTETRIVYVDKNNFANVKEFRVDYNPILMEWIFARVRKQNEYVKNMVVPPAEALYCHACFKAKLKVAKEGRSKVAWCPACQWKGKLDETDLWRCNYCPYKKWCWDLEAKRDKMTPEQLVQLEALSKEADPDPKTEEDQLLITELSEAKPEEQK